MVCAGFSYAGVHRNFYPNLTINGLIPVTENDSDHYFWLSNERRNRTHRTVFGPSMIVAVDQMASGAVTQTITSSNQALNSLSFLNALNAMKTNFVAKFGLPAWEQNTALAESSLIGAFDERRNLPSVIRERGNGMFIESELLEEHMVDHYGTEIAANYKVRSKLFAQFV
jgi:hypothetical protein